MTVAQITETLGLTVFSAPEPDREVTGGYVGDLLSWVMGRARAGEAWITIMSNRNVAAVAQLTDCALVILSEGVRPDPDALEAFKTRGMNLLGSRADTFSLCRAVGELLA